jgi:hypothetical protein
MEKGQKSTIMAMTIAMRSPKGLKNPSRERKLIATSMLAWSKFNSVGGGPQSLTFSFQYRHCVGSGESEEGSHQSCGIQTRDYNVPLRIGTLFVVLIASAIGVFAPILLAKLHFASINSVVSTVLKQFGTGIIIATAFVHVSRIHVSTKT